MTAHRVGEIPVQAQASATTGRGRRGGGLGAAGWIGLTLLALYAVVTVFGDVIAPYRAVDRVGLPYQQPSAAHLLGTDDVGRDLATLMVLGTRTSLAAGLGVAVLATAVAAVIGSVAGLSRGWVGTVLMRLADVVLVLPFLPLLVVAASFLGRGLLLQVLLISGLVWPRPARLVRAQTLAARSRGHVEAAEGMGASPVRLLWRHVSYPVAPLLIPLFVRAAMTAVLVQAALAFLGLGDPLQPSWGTMLYWANVRSVFLTDAWLWWVLPPGAAIAGVVVALGLLGVVVEDRLNPSLAAEVDRAAAR